MYNTDPGNLIIVSFIESDLFEVLALPYFFKKMEKESQVNTIEINSKILFSKIRPFKNLSVSFVVLYRLQGVGELRSHGAIAPLWSELVSPDNFIAKSLW